MSTWVNDNFFVPFTLISKILLAARSKVNFGKPNEIAAKYASDIIFSCTSRIKWKPTFYEDPDKKLKI